MEEAYIFLELDSAQRVNEKKKGLVLAFNVHNKDVKAPPEEILLNG